MRANSSIHKILRRKCAQPPSLLRPRPWNSFNFDCRRVLRGLAGHGYPLDTLKERELADRLANRQSRS